MECLYKFKKYVNFKCNNVLILYFVISLDETKVAELQEKLAEKDEMLTETRLEALNSAAQLQALRETVAKLRAELNGIKKGGNFSYYKLY